MSWMDFWRPYPELKTAIINLKNGTSFRAVIWRRRGPFMVLKNTEMLRGEGIRALDGEVIIPMNDIEFIQVP